ncbi:MAG: hypothetical protein CBC35_10665 [Planctomycetes bacterium TMED75]|nr:hypothetical protein [Planctomycetaceae bacterium]OUU90863.1 MAG: hypothetical protein CBC35_10665 [Planctomycetes bacterium TMED75]
MGTMDRRTSQATQPSQALIGALGKVHDLIVSVTDEQYIRSGMKGFASPLGAHVRHCLDHVDALLLGLQEEVSDPEVRYDRRERGTRLETDRSYAMSVCKDRCTQVRELNSISLQSPVRVLALVSPDQPEAVFESTGSRELLYVFHHTVHHLALMAAHAEYLGISMERELGRAPATLAADQDT